MSDTLLKRLAIGLATLVALWLIAAWFRADPEPGATTFALPVVDTALVDSIVIQRPADRVSLRRTDAAWTVNGHLADSAALADFLDVFGEETRADLVAMNPSSHSRLEVDDAQGRTLRVYQEGDLSSELIVGKRGASFQNVYLRRTGEDRVYEVQTSLATHVDRALDDWRNKRLATIDADSVGEVAILRGGTPVMVRREADSSWTVNGAPADAGAVRRLLDQFSSLNASGFPRPEQRDSIDFADPEREVTVRDRASQPLVEMVMDSAAAGFWVRKTGDSVVYRLDRFRVNQLTPADSTLRPNPGG